MGLGDEFIRELDRTFEALASRPTSFPAVRGQVRRALLARFPYGVFFVATETTVTVLAVIHARRHPQLWPLRPAR